MIQKCKGHNREGLPCKKTAGWGTLHPGQGNCKFHGGATPIKHGRYSKIRWPALDEKLREFQEADFQAGNLEQAALNAWAIFSHFLDTWSGMLTSEMASQAAELLERISRIVARMHKIQNEGSISMDMFRHVMEQMAVVVANHTDEDTCRRIEKEWRAIRLDARAVNGGG